MIVNHDSGVLRDELLDIKTYYDEHPETNTEHTGIIDELLRFLSQN